MLGHEFQRSRSVDSIPADLTPVEERIDGKMEALRLELKSSMELMLQQFTNTLRSQVKGLVNPAEVNVTPPINSDLERDTVTRDIPKHPQTAVVVSSLNSKEHLDPQPGGNLGGSPSHHLHQPCIEPRREDRPIQPTYPDAYTAPQTLAPQMPYLNNPVQHNSYPPMKHGYGFGDATRHDTDTGIRQFLKKHGHDTARTRQFI